MEKAYSFSCAFHSNQTWESGGEITNRNAQQKSINFLPHIPASSPCWQPTTFSLDDPWKTLNVLQKMCFIPSPVEFIISPKRSHFYDPRSRLDETLDCAGHTQSHWLDSPPTEQQPTPWASGGGVGNVFYRHYSTQYFRCAPVKHTQHILHFFRD